MNRPVAVRSVVASLWSRPILALFAAVTTLMATACTAEVGVADSPPSPFASCLALTTPSAAASPAVIAADSTAAPHSVRASLTAEATPSSQPAGPGAGQASELPAVQLPCFTGGAQVALSSIPGPALVNIWASWCGPCRAELPIIQQLADRTAGRLTVLGVDSEDTRSAGASFATDHGVDLPTLFDQDGKVTKALGRITLPITLLIDSAGHQFIQAPPMTADTIDELVHVHTGVSVKR